MNNDQMYDTLKALIEKYNVIVEKEGGQKVFWDFGVTKENADGNFHLKINLLNY